MNKRLVLAFTGHPGAGKTEAATYVASQYGMSLYSPGELIRVEATKRGLTIPSRAAGMQFVHEILEPTFGLDALIEPVLKTEGNVVIDALRRMYDLRRLRAEFRLVLVALTPPI